MTVGTKALLWLAIGSKALLAVGSKALLAVATVNWLGLGIDWLSTISSVGLSVDWLAIGVGVDGLSIDGLSVTRLSIDGLAVDGLRAVGRWLICRLRLDMRRREAILSLSLGLAHLT